MTPERGGLRLLHFLPLRPDWEVWLTGVGGVRRCCLCSCRTPGLCRCHLVHFPHRCLFMGADPLYLISCSCRIHPEHLLNPPQERSVAVRVWIWNCCGLVCASEWKMALIMGACSHVLWLGMHTRRDGYRFVFALLFVRSLSPRLFMRFSAPPPPRLLGKLQRRVPLLLRFRYGLSSC